MYDKQDLYAWYLPDALKPLAPAWSTLAYRLNSPWLMGTLSFRATLDRAEPSVGRARDLARARPGAVS